jgi:broad specificity phosphatase PhoE
MSRTFILASAAAPAAAARAVATAPAVPDLCVVSPSSSARQTAVFAVRGRWIYTVEEPLLATRGDGEGGEDVLARLAQALRVVLAYDANLPLIVCDRMNILGATAVMFDEEGLSRLADDLDRALVLQ